VGTRQRDAKWQRADSRDSDCGHSSEELDYEEESNEDRDLRDSRYYVSLEEKKMDPPEKKQVAATSKTAPPPHLRCRRLRSRKKKLSATSPIEKEDRQTEPLLARAIDRLTLCRQKWWCQRGADTNLRLPRRRSRQPSEM
jgi:hypothetical protein